MNLIKRFIFLALLCATTLALADPPGQVGRLNFLSGTVSFAAADANNDWMEAPLNRPVTTGDRLWADRDGRAEMRIGSTAIRMHALTSLDVLRLDDEVTQLRLALGTLNVRLRQLDAGDSFEISTPGGAVLLTQPGDYRVSVDAAGTTTSVLVRRGQADVLTGNTPLVVRDNQFIAFSALGQEPFAAPVADEFDQWASLRDRQEDRVVATRYVAPSMTGYEDLDQHGTWQETPQYGSVWMPTAVAAGWAPYRDGRWVWISPWGWTWVDSAPWGFAPYHYGRWVWLGHRWAWAPGARVARPVYAPALVAFVGGANWSVSAGPAVGWVPLGWREPYIPWYRHSPAHVRNVNISHVTNINIIQHYSNVHNVTRIRYVNRDVPSATTVVTRDTFVSARRVHEARLNVPAHTLAAAHVAHDLPMIRPDRRSVTITRPGARLPDAIATREVVVAREPAPPARFVIDGTAGNARRGDDERPRVRVLGAPPAVINAPRVDRPDRAGERRLPADQPPQAAPRPQTAPLQTQAPVSQPPPADPQQQARAQERLGHQQKLQEQTERQQQAAQQRALDAQHQRDRQQQQAQMEQQQQRARAQDAQHQRERQLQQAQQEQQQQARAQAKLAQQQKLQEQKERQHQAVQQRTHDVQLQREHQFQQAQQVQQQQQLRQQQAREQRQAERVEQQRQSSARAPHPSAPPGAPAAPGRERRGHEPQGPQQR